MHGAPAHHERAVRCGPGPPQRAAGTASSFPWPARRMPLHPAPPPPPSRHATSGRKPTSSLYLTLGVSLPYRFLLQHVEHHAALSHHSGHLEQPASARNSPEQQHLVLLYPLRDSSARQPQETQAKPAQAPPGGYQHPRPHLSVVAVPAQMQLLLTGRLLAHTLQKGRSEPQQVW